MTGTVEKVDVREMHNKSEIDLSESQVSSAIIQLVAGGSRVHLPLLRTLRVDRATGGSKVTDKGEPAVTLGSVSGAGTVKRED